MSTLIIKSPSMNGTRVQLGAAQGEQPEGAMHQQTAMDEMEQRLRAELSRHFEEKLDQVRESARQEGYQDGYKEGLTSGHADGVQAGTDMLAKQLALLESTLAESDKAIASFWQDTEAAATELAFESVCQLMGEHALDVAAVTGMVRQVIRRLNDSDVTRIRLHPAECAALRRALKGDDHALQLQMARLAERLLEDARLESGGCVIETPRGDYCASLDVQLTRLRRVLQQRRMPDLQSDLPSGVACA